MSHIPDDAWLMILEYVPLAERIHSVQLVSKRLNRLCWDHCLTKSLDFTEQTSIDDKKCLQIIKGCKRYVGSISFRECSHFTGAVFSHIPPLPSLRSLDLTRCLLTGKQLLHFLIRCPKLQKLSFHVDFQVSQTLLEEPKNFQLSIRRLHLQIHCMCILDWIDEFLEDFVSTCLVSKSELLSFSCGITMGPKSALASYSNAHASIMSPETLQVNSLRMLCDGDWKCPWEILSAYGSMPNSLTLSKGPSSKMNINTLKFLEFAVLPDEPGYTVQHYRANLGGISFPSVECLMMQDIAQSQHKRGRHPFVDLLWDIVSSCKFPKMRCLKLNSKSHDCDNEIQATPLDMECFRNILGCGRLEEVCLKSLPMLACAAIDSIPSPHVTALSIPVFLCEFQVVQSLPPRAGAAPRSRNIARVVQNTSEHKCSPVDKLLLRWPHLESLEIYDLSTLQPGRQIPAIALRPISRLASLRTLSLADIPQINDFSFLLDISKGCKMLRSLTLSNLGARGECKYQGILGAVTSNLSELRQLRLCHNHISLSKSFFSAICTCKKLEQLVILANSGSEPKRLVLTRIKSVVHCCIDLGQLAICVGNISGNCEVQVKRYVKELYSKSRRSLTQICIRPLQSDLRSVPLVFSKLLDFHSSIICDYTAYDFPYSS